MNILAKKTKPFRQVQSQLSKVGTPLTRVKSTKQVQFGYAIVHSTKYLPKTQRGKKIKTTRQRQSVKAREKKALSKAMRDLGYKT